MDIRKAQEADIPAILNIYREAKKAMAASGIDQWQNDYPNEESLRDDMDTGVSYVLVENNQVLATACVAIGHEPTYDTMQEGAWEQDANPYGFIHRIAVSSAAKGRGAASFFFEELFSQMRAAGCTCVRVDTHENNLPMQRVIEKNGLSKKGIILVEDGTPRLAYEGYVNP